MEESLKEMTVGIVLTFNHLRDIHGKMLQLIFTTHHFSKPPLENSQRLPKFKVPIVWLGSVIQLQLIISPLLVTLQRTHLLPDILNLRIFNQAITIPMVPEEETIKLWLEELLLIQELLTNQHQRLVLKLLTSQLERFLIFMMLLKSIEKKDIN